MHAYEVWKDLSPTLHHDLLEATYLNNKKLYRTLVHDVAGNLRMRPEKLLSVSRVERHQLFHPILSMPQFHVFTQNVLMEWLRYTQRDTLVKFLDLLGIQHDSRGFSDAFPETMDNARLTQAVKELRAALPGEATELYLKTFDSVTGVSWSKLAELVSAPVPAKA